MPRMSTARERFAEVGKKISGSERMARRHILGPVGTLNTVTPCAACKLLRRRCAQECPFSPYFSPHEPQKFALVHKVFGASNVSKMLMEVPEAQRADAANSLVYEANLRIRNPVYGCMGAILALQQQLQVLEAELATVQGGILKHKYRQASNTEIPALLAVSSHGTAMSARQHPPAAPSASSSSSIYNPSTSTDYSSITNENAAFFG